MNVLAYLKLNIVYGDSHRNRLLMFIRHVNEQCQEVLRNSPKKGKSLKLQVNVMHKLAKELNCYMTDKDLKEEIKIIEALEPSMLCIATPNRIKKKLNILNEDIENFHKIFGYVTDYLVSMFKMPKHWRNSKRPVELRDSFMINSFCTHAENVLEAITDLDQRLENLKAVIQPSEDASIMREENPMDQLENVYVNGEIIENLLKTNSGTKRDLVEMRKCNRRVNLILREEDFELSEYDLHRVKMIRDLVVYREATCGIGSPSGLKLMKFDELLLKFNAETESCRLKHLKKCLEYDTFFLSLNDSNSDENLIIIRKVASFFKEVLNDYKMYDNQLEIVKTEIDKLWDYYV